ncbi:RNA-processing protein [Candidatus Woesearchaeota archaeon]|nr:RNA-processing protein [Candidatus Woesearchaeota archaeon]
MTEDTFEYILKIPKERVAILIGTKGATKRKLEKITATTLSVDSTEGEITITGTDALLLYVAREIVRAIGRGFSPEIAFLLQKQDYALEVITLGGTTKNDMIRIKGRVIGEGGKSRRVIEDLTGAYISVYGKTVSIIGEFEQLRTARKAVEMLLEGAAHATVYKMLEKKRRMRPPI